MNSHKIYYFKFQNQIYKHKCDFEIKIDVEIKLVLNNKIELEIIISKIVQYIPIIWVFHFSCL